MGWASGPRALSLAPGPRFWIVNPGSGPWGEWMDGWTNVKIPLQGWSPRTLKQKKLMLNGPNKKKTGTDQRKNGRPLTPYTLLYICEDASKNYTTKNIFIKIKY